MNDPYLTICDAIFDDWLAAAPEPDIRRKLFEVQYAPEPYLIFGEGEPGCVFVFTNPGQGFAYQRRPAETADSLFKGVTSYAQAARRLGAFYSRPDSPIAPAARTNIRAMLRIAQLCGSGAVMQVELAPWHSPTLPNKRRAFADLESGDATFRGYQAALRDFLARQPVVLCFSAGTPESRRGAGVEPKASSIGLDLESCEFVVLDSKNGAASQALLWSRGPTGLRGLFVSRGAAILPSERLNRAGQHKSELIRGILAARPIAQ